MPNLLRYVRKNLFVIIILAPAFLYLLAFLILILDRVTVLSLTYIAPDLSRTFPSLRNYIDLANNPVFWDAFKGDKIVVNGPGHPVVTRCCPVQPNATMFRARPYHQISNC